MTNGDVPYFRPVRDIYQSKVVTCLPDDNLVGVVEIMRERNISSVVVCDQEDKPIGIITDRDLRNKVVPSGREPSSFRVRDIMNSPLTTIGEDDVLYEALYRMSSLNIHRLVVVNGGGNLIGIVTDTDILRMQSHSPHQLVRDIEKAADFETLRDLHARIQDLVVHLSGTATSIRDLSKLIAHLNDQIIVRLLALLIQQRFPDIGTEFSFVVMGSEGRGEQTLSTDQDNAIIMPDDYDSHQIAATEEFSKALIDNLISIGVPACPGGIMASNEPWRRSVAQWKRELDRWLTTPSPENIPNASMFADIRTLYGSTEWENSLKAHIYRRVSENKLFLMRMTENMVRFPPPLNWRGKIKTGTQGAPPGQIDLKKAGIFAITDGIKALAIEAKMLEGGTHQRIKNLLDIGVLAKDQAHNLSETFDFLVQMRLRAQVRAIEKSESPGNNVDFAELSQMEQGRLLIALEDVARFQRFMSSHFNLKLLG